MIFRVAVEVSGLEGIADPEGQTIERALPLLGFEGIGHVRAGRIFRFEVVASDESEARARSEELCDRLLANPVIQRGEVTVLGTVNGSDATGAGGRPPGEPQASA